MLIPLAFVLGLMAGYLIWGRSPLSLAQSPAAAVNEPAPSGEVEPTQQIIRYDIPIEGNPILGAIDAPITIVEFSDYECPFCRRWHLEVFPLIRQAYPDQVRFVFRDFPLTSIHPNAVPAAEAASCANEQGKFWEFNEALFSMQFGLDSEAYLAYGEMLGLEMPSFSECLSSGRYRDEVLADLKWASDLGVRSTPTFFLNGIALVGAQPFEFFKQVIDKELAGEIP
jgi:protein-disulfide isomerase